MSDKYDNHPKIVEARKEFDKKLARLKRELEIEELLPQQLQPFVKRLVVHKDETWVLLERKNEKQTWQKNPFKVREVLDLLTGIETIPTEVTKGTFTSVHAKDQKAPAGDEGKFLNNDHPEFVFSIRLDIHGEADMEVYTKLGEGLVKLSFDLGSALSYKLRETSWEGRQGFLRVKKCHAIPVAGAHSITWARGSNENPNDVTALVYDVEAFLAAVEGKV